MANLSAPMKSLEQIEPRKSIGSLPFYFDAFGSQLLATNLNPYVHFFH
jgi:hypothetical protein